MLFYVRQSVFPIISGSVMHPFIVYTLIAVMILHYRYLWGAVCATTKLLRTACLLHDLLNLPHDLLNRSHDLLYRSYYLLNLPHNLLNRSHDLLYYRSYDLLNLPY